MIVSLSIRNLVIIEHVAISFEDGFSIFSGETGAGKSIIFDGLSLVCGARADRGLVRTGCDKASVTAEFDIQRNAAAIACLHEAGRATEDDRLIIRRQVDKNGRSRAWINDEAASVSLLASLSAHLLDLNAQNDAQLLLEDRQHVTLIDSYAAHVDLLSVMREGFADWTSLEKARSEELARLTAIRERQDWITAQVRELDAFAPKASEFEELRGQRQQLLSADKTRGDVEFALQQLTASDGVQSVLSELLNRLGRAKEHDPTIRESFESIDRGLIEMTEAVSCLETLLTGLESPRHSLEEIEYRLFTYQDLARKHQVEADELIAWLDDHRQWLEDIESVDQRMEQWDRKVADARAHFIQAAAAVTKSRQVAAISIVKAVLEELPSLKLDHARFKVETVQKPERDWNANGVDEWLFEVAMNPGQPFSRLSQTASGGERSRLFLALKVALSRTNAGRTLIFDEVDSGAGGAVADAIGRHLAHLSRDGQVMSVTHSPQVAARAHQHFLIEKHVEDGASRTEVQCLDVQGREREVARMVSGAEITEAALMTARNLMQGA